LMDECSEFVDWHGDVKRPTCAYWQVFWRRRTCLERFLLVVSACLVVVVIVLLSLIASHEHDVPPQPHDSKTQHHSSSTGFTRLTCSYFEYSVTQHHIDRIPVFKLGILVKKY